MYIYSGYLNDIDMEIVDITVPLLVSACGIYRLVQRAVMDTCRPEGRKDYQLLYISSGRAFFEIEAGTFTEVSAGHMVIYRPGDLQHYRYFAEDHPEVCWIHFTGFEAEKVLDEAGFLDKKILFCGVSSGYPELFRRIIRELLLIRPCFEEFLPLYLRQIFSEIHRNQYENALTPCPNRAEMAQAVHDFNESFTSAISIKDYAAAHHMSVCCFIRSFRLYMGMTPMQYVTSLRITRAKELLSSTDYSIQEIGALVGYENPLYFSRIFKKQTGSSPSAYRHS